MDEIVAAKIGNEITNNPKTIYQAVYQDIPVKFLSRKRMEFMACCDLGYQWTQLSKGKTLFRIDENGEILAPE